MASLSSAPAVEDSQRSPLLPFTEKPVLGAKSVLQVSSEAPKTSLLQEKDNAATLSQPL